MPAVSKPQLPISGLGRAGAGVAGCVAGSTTVCEGAGAAGALGVVGPGADGEGLLDPQPPRAANDAAREAERVSANIRVFTVRSEGGGAR
jgi:hypothetical protein